MTENGLGMTLLRLASRDTGFITLEGAAAAFRPAHPGVRTRERTPLGWASTQNNLGNALLMLGSRETGTAHLEEAAAAYRAALQERTRDRVPLDWAETQNQPRARASGVRWTRELSRAFAAGGRGVPYGAGGTGAPAGAASVG